MAEKTYIYCNVLPANYQSPYYYIADFDVVEGDFVIIPLRAENNEKVGLVVEVLTCNASSAPYPPQYTKHILRKFGNAESEKLKHEKKKLDEEKAVRFKSPELAEKLIIKQALIYNGVNASKAKHSKEIIANMMSSVSSKNEKFLDTLADICDATNSSIQLSDDKKTIIGFKKSGKKGYLHIQIPEGVEAIEDNAFLRVDFDSIYIPKTLTHIGKYTLFHPTPAPIWERYAKNVKTVEVAAGNPRYAADKTGFYEIIDGKKQLCFLFDRSIEAYHAPADVVSFADTAFGGCEVLKDIFLSKTTEAFDEYSLPSNSKVEEIYIPKNVKHIKVKRREGGYAEWFTARYRIDEGNKYLFQDEDSIYEVLADDTYKLISNFYTGKGRTLILDGTSVIGENAFRDNHNLTTIQLPDTVRIIEKNAFSDSSVSEITCPSGIERIESCAFYRCTELSSVFLPSSLKFIAEDAFQLCENLHKIASDDGKTYDYNYRAGEIRKNDNSAPKVLEKKNASSISQKAKCFNRDNSRFAQFARKAVDIVVEESVKQRERKNDRAKYDSDAQIITITSQFSQYNRDASIVKERVACAEAVHEGDAVIIRITSNAWEVFTMDGRSLGELEPLLGRTALPYVNEFTFSDCKIATITPKSKRRGNAKYATGSVEFEIRERILPDNLTAQDVTLREQFAYAIEENEARLIRWIGGTKTVSAIIPSSIEGKPVVTMPPCLFESDLWSNIENKIEELTISNGIKRIEASSLQNLRNVRKIVFPASVEYIDPNVFSNISGEYKDLYLSDKIVFVAPSGSYAEKFLKEYEPDCYACKILNVVNNESNQTKADLLMRSLFEFELSDHIGIVASFKQHYKIEHFDDSVVSIPELINGKPLKNLSLYNIPKCVEKLIIPDTVTNLVDIDSEYLFSHNGQNLKTVIISDDNPAYWSDGTAVFTKDRKTLLRVMLVAAEEYTLPETTECIADNAFAGCDKLSQLYGLEHVKKVGKNALPRAFFKKCTNLTIGKTVFKMLERVKVVEIPDGIETIASSAFCWGVENDWVEEIILPESVRTIEASAFSCKALKKVNIPNGVKELKSSLFYSCSSLEELYIPASVEKINVSAFPHKYKEDCLFRSIKVDPQNKCFASMDGMLFSKDMTELIFVPYQLQKNILAIPDGVSHIHEELAQHNKTLTEIVFPDSLRYIGASAFAGCESLTTVVIPDAVNSIGANAFSGCANLCKIAFPKKLESISEYMCASCVKLTNIIWPENLLTIGDYAFRKTGLNDTIFPNTLTHIGSQAFAEIPLKKAALPKSVRTLGWGAFSCVPEIELYDSIDPSADEADKGIDTINGNPNSMVGFVGIGPAFAMWECAANHKWVNYTIIVKSVETDEIKYKVWMGADSTRRDDYCFLSSAWGHNATFAFKQLDERFSNIRGTEHKLKIANYRLEYPIDLSDGACAKYQSYVKRYS